MDDEEVAPVEFTLMLLPGDTRPASPSGMAVIARAKNLPAEGRGGNVTEAIAELARVLRGMRNRGE